MKLFPFTGSTDMSLSHYYSDIDLYLTDVLQFLKEFQWIYTTSNTEFIVRGTLREIPADWISTIDSLSLNEWNEIPFDFVKESWPSSFRKFLTTLKKLKPPIAETDPIYTNQTNKDELLRGIKPKKIHEIIELSNEISRYCDDVSTDSTIFVDLGCGVGHLTYFLNRKFEYKILGLEADPDRVKTAAKIQTTKFPESIAAVKVVQHFIGSSSASFIQSALMNEFNLSQSPDLILIGLHACADLTVTALDLFLRNPNCKKMLIMPCCYHKMKFKENSLDEFENFPLSQRVKSVPYVNHIINRPFLRLAGQQTALRWRNSTESEHAEHGRNMFLRGVVQALLQEDEMVLKNKKVAGQDDASENTLGQYTLVHKHSKEEKTWSNSQKLAFDSLLKEYPNGGILSEFLTCLQASIQSVCENLVLLDRLLYVEEEAVKLQVNVKKISVKKIVNENISPRCFVMIAEKNK